jgi:hypothetical protein
MRVRLFPLVASKAQRSLFTFKFSAFTLNGTIDPGGKLLTLFTWSTSVTLRDGYNILKGRQLTS